MRGGGRRSPPLTRKSSGGELPHFDNPPARVNAGYNAVNRGIDGKFVSSLGSSNVQKMVASINDQARGSLERGPALMEEGETTPTEVLEGRDGVDSGCFGGRQHAQTAMDVLDVKGLEPKIRGEAASLGPEKPIHSILDSSPSSTPAGSGVGGLDVENLRSSTTCPAAVCLNVKEKNSCTGAGIFLSNKFLMEEDGHNAQPNNMPSSPDGCGLIMDDTMEDPGCSLKPGAAAYNVDSNTSSLPGAGISAWIKPGVTPLPSIKDMPHLQPLDGAARLDEEEVSSYISCFDGALVGRLFGRHIPFFHLNVELRRRWERFGTFRLMTLSNECFICFFDDVRARDAVLMGGPWAIAGQVIGLDRWTPGFSPSTTHGFITPVWVRFPDLPFYCWGMRNLASISSLLGEPLWVDDTTLNMSKGAYARVCIKIDLSQPLLPSVSVIGRDGTFRQQVEYEGLTAFCSKCGRVGHKNIHCNPTLAAGGRVDMQKKTRRITHKVNDIGRTPIFGFSATAPPSGTCTASHPTSKSRTTVQSDALRPPLEPLCEDDQGGAGPWKVVPTRRRGRRLRQHQVGATTAAHISASGTSQHGQKDTQVQEDDPPPTLMDDQPDSSEQHLGATEQQHDAEVEELQQEDRVVSTPPFFHSRDNFRMGRGFRPRGREADGKPQRGRVFHTPLGGEEQSDRSGKYKKRKSATIPDDEDAASFRPP